MPCPLCGVELILADATDRRSSLLALEAAPILGAPQLGWRLAPTLLPTGRRLAVPARGSGVLLAHAPRCGGRLHRVA